MDWKRALWERALEEGKLDVGGSQCWRSTVRCLLPERRPITDQYVGTVLHSELSQSLEPHSRPYLNHILISMSIFSRIILS